MNSARYLELFAAEAREQIAVMESAFARLESSFVELSAAEVTELLSESFRQLHSLKGSAGTLSFGTITRWVHRMEDVLALVTSLHEKSAGRQASTSGPEEGLTGAEASHLLNLLLDACADLTQLVDEQLRQARGAGTKSQAAKAEAEKAPQRLDDVLEDVLEDVFEESSSEAGLDSLSFFERRSGVERRSGLDRRDPEPDFVPGLKQDSQQALEQEPEEDSGSEPHRNTELERASDPAQNSELGAEVFPEGWDPKSGVVLHLRVSKDEPLPGVRSFLAIRQLSALGTLLGTIPSAQELRQRQVPAETLQQQGLRLFYQEAIPEAGLKQALAKLPEFSLVQPASGGLSSTHFAEQGGADSAEQGRVDAEGADGRAPFSLKPGEQSIKVRVELLDQLLELAGELVLASSQVHELSKQHASSGTSPELEEHSDKLRLLVKELNHRVLAARQTPFKLLFDRLPLVVRKLARQLDRKVKLELYGESLTLDRGLLDALAEPLLHTLRNALDHGIEPPNERLSLGKPENGRLRLTVHRERDRVVLEVSDDGRGFDPETLKERAVAKGLLSPERARSLSEDEALRLAFLTGLSTRNTASEISGRGVGMDAVLRVSEQLGGSVAISSVKGQGSSLRFSLPASVSMVNLLLLSLGDEILGIPMSHVLQVAEPLEPKVQRVSFEGQELECRELDQLLGLDAGAQGLSHAVVVDAGSRRIALKVSALLGQEEVVLRPLGMPLDRIPGLSGTAVLGSGRPVFVLDVTRLAG